MSRRVVVPNSIVLGEVSRVIASGQKAVLLTKGSSMLPFIIGERDSVELSPTGGRVEVGDIVLANIPLPHPRYVLHRIIAIEGDSVTLMGDGNYIGTEKCSSGQVVARVTSIIKPHKSVDPNSKRERLYAKVWYHLAPVRRYLLAIRRRAIRHLKLS